MLTVGSLFAGIGGFDAGFDAAGMRTAWQVEIDPDAQRVLRKHWPDALLVYDVRDCRRGLLPKVDVICAGSPCQDLSVAGKRKGLAGERSGLFFEAMRIVRELRPAFAIWENVPGALSSNAGRDFAAVLDAFRECGARDIAWRVLDARYFGVAQRRRRVFVVADFRGERAGQILFESPCVCRNPAPGRQARAGVASTLRSRSASNGVSRPGRGGEDDVNLVAHSLTASRPASGRMDPNGETYVTHCPEVAYTLTDARGTGDGHGQGWNSNYVTHALTSGGADASEDGTGRGTPLVAGPLMAHSKEHGHAMSTQQAAESDHLVTAFNIIGLGQEGSNHAYETDLAGCLQHKGLKPTGNEAGTVIGFSLSSDPNNWLNDGVPPLTRRHGDPGNVATDMIVRRLLPVECLRLMGMRDDWLDLDPPLSDSAKYRLIGNSIVVPVAEWIGRRIVEATA